MPFRHFRSSSSHNNAAQSGILQAAQALGSIGAPQGNLRSSAQQLPSNQTPSNQNTVTHHPFTSIMATSSNASGQYPPNTSQQYESGRRSQYGRQPDELHMGPKIDLKPEDQNNSQYHGRQPSDLQMGPKIEVKPEEDYNSQAHLGNSQIGGSGNLPGTLQPGRPGLSTNMSSDYNKPSRSNSYSHGYSRSSPSAPASGFDPTQGNYTYPPTPGSHAAEPFASPTQKYTPGQQRNVSSTPLGLADIRPRADSNVGETLLPGANPYSYDGTNAVPTNSNYLAPWALYAFDWCKWPAQNGEAGKVAVGSYLEDGHNFIQILDTKIVPQDSYASGGPKQGIEFIKIAEATHSYPVTRLLWEPPSSQKQSTDLLATSGDHLRLWSLPAENSEQGTPGSSIHRGQSTNSSSQHGQSMKLSPLALLSNSKTPEHTAPLTSLDWNTVSPSLIITSSIDTTCTIWDIPTLTAKTQLIAHDKEVFDVRFCANSVDVFVSCGADGSVRMFDLRSLEHSTIIYEPSAKDDKDASPNAGRISPTLAQQTLSYAPPLLRLAASPHDTHLLATFSQDSNIIRILDVRQPGQALLELKGHGAAINCIDWSPSRRGMLASGADDSLVLIWDLLNQSNNLNSAVTGLQNAGANGGGSAADNSRGPTASWKCDYEVGNISWAPHSSLSSEGDWIGVSGGRGIWGVKV